MGTAVYNHLTINKGGNTHTQIKGYVGCGMARLWDAYLRRHVVSQLHRQFLLQGKAASIQHEGMGNEKARPTSHTGRDHHINHHQQSASSREAQNTRPGSYVHGGQGRIARRHEQMHTRVRTASRRRYLPISRMLGCIIRSQGRRRVRQRTNKCGKNTQIRNHEVRATYITNN